MAKGKIMGMSTTTVLLLAAGAGVLWYMSQPKQVYIPPQRPYGPPLPSSAATTAAEIAAGTVVATSLLDDLFGNNESYVSGVAVDGCN